MKFKRVLERGSWRPTHFYGGENRVTAPKAPVLLFDSNCILCLGAVSFIVKRDRGVFRFGPLSSLQAQGLLQNITLPKDLDSMILVENGLAYWRSDAVVRVMEKLRGWKLLAPMVRMIPRRFRDSLYDFVAKRRRRLLPANVECALPSAALRRRLL